MMNLNWKNFDDRCVKFYVYCISLDSIIIEEV